MFHATQKILSYADLRQMKPFEVFHKGFIYTDLSYNIPAYKFLCKRGEITDWMIYFGSTDQTWEEIETRGQKIRDKDLIRKIILCDDAALGAYRSH